jgi:hypothetical protein
LQEVWSQKAASGLLRTVHDVSMVGQLGHFRTRQQDRDRLSLGDLDDDVMRHMEACLEHGTPQTAVWIDREAEFSDYGQDSILRPEVYSFVGTKILGMRPSELCDAGFGALLERMRVSETCMIDSFHYWENLRASRAEYAVAGWISLVEDQIYQQIIFLVSRGSDFCQRR